MKVAGILIINIFLCFSVFAQNKCDVSNLSLKQKRELQQFWNNLRKAVNNKDKIALGKLCHFPFNCSFCEPNKSNSLYLVVNKKIFYKEQYKIFFTKYFCEVVNNNEILQILKGDTLENGSCDYNFSFPIIKPSKKGEGLQGFLTIKEIANKYQIISAWSVP